MTQQPSVGRQGPGGERFQAPPAGPRQGVTSILPTSGDGDSQDSAAKASEITRTITAIDKGESRAGEELLPLVYDELRRLATAKMAREAAGQTLQPTALVHEAWLRLAGSQNQAWDGRAHFFAAAAEAMRRILIEKARRRRAARHGGGLQRVDFDEVNVACPAPDDQLLAVDEALDRLAAQYPRQAQIVKLRYFVGMTLPEAAETLDICLDTAKDDSAFARAWLFHEFASTRQPPISRSGGG